MFTDLSNFLTDLLASFRTVVRIGSVPPSGIEEQDNHTQLNFSALIVATLLYFVDRAAYQPLFPTTSLLDAFFVNLTFVVLAIATVFVVSFATALANGDKSADKLGDKWTTFLTHVWILSLLAFGIDLAYQHYTGNRLLAANLDGLFSGYLNPAVSYTLVALVFVAFRSRLVFQRNLRDQSALFAFIAAFVFNSAFMYALIFRFAKA